MHGRIKVKTSWEKEEEAVKLRAEELRNIRRLWNAVNELRRVTVQDQSDELLRLSAELLSKNPDFYTLFNVRRETILRKAANASKTDPPINCKDLFLVELEFTKRCLMVNPKSYGVWHHRRWTLLNMPEPDWRQELKLCNYALDLDERNFHVWDYRRFVAEHAKISPANEFAYTHAKIVSNFSNYSAWHYRSNLLSVILSPDSVVVVENTPETRRQLLYAEIELINSAMYTDPNDEAVWHYTEWLLHFAQNNVLDANEFQAFLCRIREAVEEVISLEPDARRPIAMSLDLMMQFPSEAALTAKVVQKRLAVLCREDSLRRNCYEALYGNLGS